MESVKELLDQLNSSDECTTIEAKRGGAVDRSILQTVCAFSNEPGLGGGYLLLGVELDESRLFPEYAVTGVVNPDKLQLDLATQCASMFNQPVRPEIDVEKMQDGTLVMKIFIREVPDGQKPLYFRNEGLPRGAYRRIGSSDQRCTDDDLFVFYSTEDTFDSAVVKDTSLDDVSDDALDLYRTLRSRVNPYAEELSYSDQDLLQALGCCKKENGQLLLTYTGLLVFGKRQSLRRLLPMIRVDYIRVPGNEWLSDPDTRFTTIDMRGPLIELVQRAFSAIADDLPKGFLLPEGHLQAKSVGLPSKVLREALVNAFIHRTYRENQPIQLIRYGNRIEIKNPGFSLKPEDQLGEPGSRNRNPFIAAIFHDTNLAETKGSGIRTMRALMERCGMVPPTFESDHGANQFTIRLLLHHFLSEEDLTWLEQFSYAGLSDSEKRALVFLREAGAIDNAAYRQINGCDVIRASMDLRSMRDELLLEQRGKGRSTYYVPSELLKAAIARNASSLSDQSPSLSDQSPSLSDQSPSLSDQSPSLSDQLTPPGDRGLFGELPDDVQRKVAELGKRSRDKQLMADTILALCRWRALPLAQLAAILSRNEKYLLEHFVGPLREEGKLKYTIPDMPNHPEQAYTTAESI